MREALCNTICNADYSRGNSIVIYKYLDKSILDLSFLFVCGGFTFIYFLYIIFIIGDVYG